MATTNNKTAREKLQEALGLAYKLMEVLMGFTEEEINEMDKESQDYLGNATEKASIVRRSLNQIQVTPSTHQDS